MSTRSPWFPTKPLIRYFTPTKDSVGEWSKARYKNYNLPILQHMYNGNEFEPLKCMISNKSGFVDFSCMLTKEHKQRFDIDFNHIRQEAQSGRQAGRSKDKLKSAPSSIFRQKYLNVAIDKLFEFVTIIPLSTEIHSYVTQDSAKGHITLQNYETKHWPWILQSQHNYNSFFATYNININHVTYDWMIDHLSNIDYPSIYDRI